MKFLFYIYIPLKKKKKKNIILRINNKIIYKILNYFSNLKLNIFLIKIILNVSRIILNF